MHDTQEETIYCVTGRGRIITPDGVGELEPGSVVWVSPGTHHATESDGPEPLEIACFFSPPVVPGSYEKGQSSMTTASARPRRSRLRRSRGSRTWPGASASRSSAR